MLFKRKKQDSFDTDVPKIVVGKNSSISLSYYTLKDNIIYHSDNGKNKVYQIESSIAGEGKTTVVINLAVALAKSNKKVVVLDLDFRRPKIHRGFDIPNFNGISEYMLGDCNLEQLIKKTEYGVDVVNRGKVAQNTSIIFTSDKFKKLIETLRAEYDVILFDCPPVLLVSDYIHISKLSDAIVYVISCEVTHRSQLKEAMELLKRNNSNIIGSVMTYKNSSKYRLRYGSYYNGRYYSSKYSKLSKYIEPSSEN